MAHFLKGKYKVFYQVGPSECVRDIFRFRQYKETSLQFEYVVYLVWYFLEWPEETWKATLIDSGDTRMLTLLCTLLMNHSQDLEARSRLLLLSWIGEHLLLSTRSYTESILMISSHLENTKKRLEILSTMKSCF